jgi:hypothetical protein
VINAFIAGYAGTSGRSWLVRTALVAGLTVIGIVA